jgi:hypothetical protein
MARFFSQWHHQEPQSIAAEPDRNTAFSAAHLVRIAVAAAVGLYFFFVALASEDPTTMIVGMFPIAWIAVEFAWVTLRPRSERGQR